MTLSFKSFLEKKVQTESGRVVVKTDTDSYTWSDIDKCSQLVADDLAKLGVKKGTHVGLISANSINWIITFFAIQKLGAMAMLFNFGLFPHETAKVASIADVTHLCYGEMPAAQDEEAFLNEVKNAEGSTVKFTYSIKKSIDLKQRYDEYESMKDKFGQTVDADTPCTVIFTSGSTGKPKGVILSSYNILNAAVSSRKNQTLNSSDRNCLILPMFHIFGLVAGLFANFLADSLICLPKDIRTDTLLNLIEKERCTIFHSVPTMMIALVNNKSFDPPRCSTLRCTILSGAAATVSQIQMFREKLPNEHFISSYGLSEMAPVSASDYGDTDEHLLYTVGKPFPNIEIKIQDYVTKKECRLREQGEILVQGYNLMMGYYKLSPDDQSIDEDGWLHTGDLGYLTEEEYEKAKTQMKMDQYKQQFDYYKELFSNAVNALQDAELANVEAKYDAEIDAAKKAGKDTSKLEEKAAEEKLKIQKKYADVQFAIRASEIIADTAQAIIATHKSLGGWTPWAIAAAALMGVTGAAQLAVAAAERNKVKSMTLKGSSGSSSTTGARIATGKEEGGFLDVEREQDGKRFHAKYDPNRRGYVDRPTVIVGEGPAGQSKEWIASNAAVENPTIRPILDILDRHQRAGSVRTLDLNKYLLQQRGYAQGGSIANTPLPSSAGTGISPELMERFVGVMERMERDGIPAILGLDEIDAKNKLRDKSRDIGSK